MEVRIKVGRRALDATCIRVPERTCDSHARTSLASIDTGSLKCLIILLTRYFLLSTTPTTMAALPDAKIRPYIKGNEEDHKLIRFYIGKANMEGLATANRKGRAHNESQDQTDRKSTRLNSSHSGESRMPSSA